MADEDQTTGRCGWAALGLVLVLLTGLLPGSLFGGTAAHRLAEIFGLDHAYEIGTRLLVLSGMILGLLASALAIMTVTIFIINAAKRLAPPRSAPQDDLLGN